MAEEIVAKLRRIGRADGASRQVALSADMIRLAPAPDHSDAAIQRLSDRQLWINPDCGLKTRKWDEVRPAPVNMVHAAQELRAAAQR